jgi:hypothetical protein
MMLPEMTVKDVAVWLVIYNVILAVKEWLDGTLVIF